MLRRWRFSLAVLLPAILTVALLVPVGLASAAKPLTPRKDATSVAIVTAGDWGTEFIEGAELAAETDLPVWVDTVFTDDLAKLPSILERFGRRSFPLVIGNGYLTEAPLLDVAPSYPNTLFVAVDGNASAPNIATVGFDAYSGSYLAGVLAAHVTQSDFDTRLNTDLKVGFVGGMDISVLVPFSSGFVDGASSVPGGVSTTVDWVGSFTDPDVAYDLAAAQIADGVDVIYGAAGGSGLGVARACSDLGALFIGVDNDEYYTNPGFENVMLSSVVKDFGRADYLVIDAFMGDTGDLVPGGDPWVVGLAEDAVRLAPYHDFDASLPQPIKDAVIQARLDLITP